jgi:hypothetical protein
VKIWHDKKIKRREFKLGDQVLLFNSPFKFFAGKLMSKWQGPLVIQEVYRSRAIRLHGDMRGKPHVVNRQCLKHYLAGEDFIKKVEVVYVQTPEKFISSQRSINGKF